MAIVTTFLEPGSDATKDLSFFTSTSGSVTSSTVQKNTGPCSIALATGAGAAQALMRTAAGVLADTGSQISYYLRFDALPAADALILILRTAGDLTVFSLQLKTNGILNNAPVGATLVAGVTTLAVDTWYRICISYYATNTTTFQFNVYVNGVLDSTANAGTMTRTGASFVRFFLQDVAGANRTYYYDDIYVATGGASASAQPDTGDIRVTAKLPFANGTTNGFTGSGTPSGYGSGNARYVNERPLSVSNFVSVVAAGVTVEEYNVEGRSVGDVDLSRFPIIDFMGWLYASALLSETASMILNGVTSNVALTSANTLFTAAAGSTSYPSGTGADIGLQTTALATTVSLYECGILVAYSAISLDGTEGPEPGINEEMEDAELVSY